jgi:DNA recombination protein RmuC
MPLAVLAVAVASAAAALILYVRALSQLAAQKQELTNTQQAFAAAQQQALSLQQSLAHVQELRARGQLDLTQAQQGRETLLLEISAARQQLAQSQVLESAANAQLHERDARLVELRDQLRLIEQRSALELQSVRQQLNATAQGLSLARAEFAALQARAQSDSARTKEQLDFAANAEERLRNSFQSLSSAALARSTEQLVQLAETRFNQLQEGSRGDLAQRQQAIDQMVAPVRAQLEEVGKKLQAMEVARSGAYEGLTTQVRSLAETQGQLRSETQRLVSALRAPHTRGRWAEIHLRRVVELAGLQEQCDFVEQASVTNEEGTLRPDMVIRMPGGSQVVIDAKAPLAAWLEAHEAGGPLMLDEPARKELYRAHARQVRTHVEALARKSYWAQFEKTPDFVVMFLPTEAVLGAALEADPELHELAMAQHVVLATPMTLIALLRTVAYGWRQDALAQNARQISEEGRVLYERLSKLAEHFGKVGDKLKGAVDSYNEALGSLEKRVLPAARKFKEYQAVPQESELPSLAEIEVMPRNVQSPELLGQAIPENAN